MSKKILMTTMSLDIGGAETHIAELCRALAAHGHEVTVASGGGVYVEQLTAAGVRHVTMPLYTKNPLKVISCYRALKKLIRDEKYDIVHAHARIPAFICGLLARRMDFHFVTTAHGTFDITPLWKLVTSWGEKSLAVSYDIKEYLIKNYAVPADNIGLTVNGIDTDRFCPTADGAAIAAEFRLPPSDHRVLYVSRLDRPAVKAGFDLIDAAQRLAGEYPDLQVVMVGAGDAQASVRIQAEQVNRTLGREVITLAGARTDIERFCGWANVFVGVSRSALEAMSAGCAAILTGAQGALGLFEPGVLAPSLDTNFTCRGYPLMNAAALADALRTVFAMDAASLAAMGEYNRTIVAQNYSIERMASDAERMYDSLTPVRRYRYGDIVIGGYYGYRNLGDDALLRVILDRLRENDPEVRITVLSHRPKRTEREFLVHSIWRFNPFSVICALRHARILLFGGGSQLQSATSSRSLTYYLLLLLGARRMNLKCALFANGIGPFGREHDKNRAAKALQQVDLITLRDTGSLKLLEQMGVTEPHICRSADPAFTLEGADAGWCDHLLRRAGVDGEYFILSVRDWHSLDRECIPKLAAFCREINARTGLTPLFLPMQVDRDLKLCRAASNACGGKLIAGLSPAEARTIVGGARFVCAMQLHLLIFAISAGVPAIALSYDIKINAFVSDVGSDRILPASNIDSAALLAHAESALAADRDALAATAALFRERATVSTRETVKLLREE